MPARHTPSGNEVPSNKFDLTSLAELQRRETPLALRRLLELQHMPVVGKFDAAHLQAIHKYIFQDVYDWAGEFRTVNISKPNALFPPPEHLKAGLSALLGELAAEDLLKGLSLAAWVHRAAYYLGEINAIHPFREGNGRTQREFIRQLAAADGHVLAWRQTLPQQMIEASQQSFLRKDYRGLERILRDALGA
ncbi:MAG TPA: Fic family protein [Terracidiphilus sp.]|jgi:cell filamentation protein|nr:Fic family protein [Terracidiphilus sp.]